jgi:hypothetical protein
MRHLRLRTVLTKADMPTATYGAWDGTISVLAFLLADRSADAHVLLIAGLGGALGGCLSMATGQFESTPDGASRMRSSVVMGLATLTGGLLPALGFLSGSRAVGYFLGLGLAVAMASIVVYLKREGRVGALRTYSLLVVTVGATVAVGLLAP